MTIISHIVIFLLRKYLLQHFNDRKFQYLRFTFNYFFLEMHTKLTTTCYKIDDGIPLGRNSNGDFVHVQTE